MSAGFTGSSSQYLCVASGWYNVSSDYNFTFAFWAQPAGLNDSTTTTVVWYAKSANPDASDYIAVKWFMGGGGQPGQWRAYIYDGTTLLTMTYSPPNYNWQHVALTASSPGVAEGITWAGLYVNGVLQDEDTTNVYPTTSMNRIYVGAKRSGLTVSEYYTGYVAELIGTAYCLPASWLLGLTKGWSPLSVLGGVTTTVFPAYYPLRSATAYNLDNRHGTLIPLTAPSASPTISSVSHPPVIDPCGPQIRSGATKRREVCIDGLVTSIP